MQTRRSFLAFAAVAQLVNPPARAMALHRGRPPVLRLPEVLLQTHAGRDIHFHNDLATGRLSILDLRYAAGPAAGMPGADILRGARQAAGSRQGNDFYTYSLTRQAAIGNAAELQRYMDWYGVAGGLALPAAARDEIALLRLRFGVIQSGG
jgi:hypothetical protein